MIPFWFFCELQICFTVHIPAFKKIQLYRTTKLGKHSQNGLDYFWYSLNRFFRFLFHFRRQMSLEVAEPARPPAIVPEPVPVPEPELVPAAVPAGNPR